MVHVIYIMLEEPTGMWYADMSYANAYSIVNHVLCLKNIMM